MEDREREPRPEPRPVGFPSIDVNTKLANWLSQHSASPFVSASTTTPPRAPHLTDVTTHEPLTTPCGSEQSDPRVLCYEVDKAVRFLRHSFFYLLKSREYRMN